MKPLSWITRRRRAFKQFRSTFPEEVTRCTERFPSRHYRLLLLFRERIEAVELATQNPALAFCLANQRKFRVTRSRTTVEEVSRRKQRDILGWLGFPARAGAARILAKIAPEAVHVQSMLRLRRALHDPAVCKLLAHVPAINSGVLGLVSQRSLVGAITPKLLAEVATSRDELRRAVTAGLLRDTRAMARQLRRDDLPPAFFSIRRLREVHDDVNCAFSRRRYGHVPAFRFPPPPVPGSDDIVPLCTPRDLAYEGAEQGHCVITYGDRVAAGDVFIYKVLRPERATLSIVADPAGGWEIEQLALSGNGDPRQETWDHVEAWLDQE